MASVETLRLGYNALHLVEDHGERVLVDTGPDFEGAWQLLCEQLRGRLPDRVVITHGHLDHAGLGAQWLAAGVPVVLHPRDAHLAESPSLSSETEFEAMQSYVRGTGAPNQVTSEILAGLEHRRLWAARAASHDEYPHSHDRRWPTGLRYRPFRPSCTLEDGETLGAGLVAGHCPGHTPGNIVLFHEHEGWLFSGDQLLADITPTPAIQFDPETGLRFHSLPNFVRGLQRIANAAPERCFPGHGDPFESVNDIIQLNVGQVEQRKARLLAAIKALGSATVYALAEALYPRVLQRRFWQIIATVQGHLDLLEAEDAVTVTGNRYSLR